MNQERTKRKLSGILYADVVGYSRLMEKDEENTIQFLEENKKLIGELIAEYQGRVVDSPGDNILAEFNSVVNAVDCAVKIQDKLKEKNSGLPEDKQMSFRIGVNLGDIIDEDGRIYGDGVNIAARIEGLADPGVVCISRTAYEQVKSKLNFGYEYIGEYNLKNISEPIRVFRVLTDPENAGKVIGEKKILSSISLRVAVTLFVILFLAASGSIGWIIYSHKSQKTEYPSLGNMAFPIPNITSIAVLPFENLSGDKSQDYFSEGLTEELITGLSKHPDLFITTRDPSVETDNHQQTRENSGVRYTLKGKVRWDGNKVRITVQLSEAAQGYNIWTEAYDRETKNNSLAIQSDIMWRIFREIRIRLIDRNQMPDFFPENTDNIEYTETFHLLYRYYKERSLARRPESLKKAFDLSQQLIAMKPDPWVYYMQGSILISLGNPEEAEKVALEAGKLNKGAGYGITGQIYLYKNDLESALGEYKKWVEFSPDSKNACFGTGYILFLQNKYDEAINYYETGLRIDPNPESQHFIFLGIAYSHPTANGFSNPEKAIENLHKALAPPNQNNYYAYLLLTLYYAYQNKMEEAHFNAMELLRFSPYFSLQAYRSWPDQDEAITRFHIKLLKKAGIKEGRRMPDFTE